MTKERNHDNLILNTKILEMINNSGTDFKLLIKLKDYLQSGISERITEEVREKLEETYERFNDEIPRLKYFKPFEEEVGITYLLLVDINDSEKGRPLRIKCEKKEEVNNYEFLQPEIEYIRDIVAKFIKKNLSSTNYFDFEYLKKLSYSFLDQFGNEINDISFEGKSSHLPLLVATFSHLFEEAVPVNLASTGRIINNDSVESVVGVKSKFQIAVREYPEIKKLVTKTDLKEDWVINVENIDEMLEIFFPDYSEKFKKGKLKGTFSVELSLIDTDKGMMDIIKLNKPSDYFYSPSSLESVKELCDNYKENKKGNGVIISGAMPLWFNGAIVAQLKNIAGFIANHDPKIKDKNNEKEAAVVVWSSTTQYKLGDLIFINKI